MSAKSKPVPYVLYLAVLPKYRTECMRILSDRLGDALRLFVSPAHLDSSVRTGIPESMYTTVPIKRILGNRAFVQTGHWRTALAAGTTILDLNPRSVTAWSVLLSRRLLRRRTLVWGHIHPQAGPSSSTAFLRRGMRKLADGTISYTYRDAEKAVNDIPGSTVWVAPNSLYRAEDIKPAEGCEKNSVIYVGRFAPTKKVRLLIEAFAIAVRSEPEIRLTLIGGGEELSLLKGMVARLGISEQVAFPGWIDDLSSLREYYSTAFCSASPGFAGLGLTQSLGFGVPMLVAEDEPHSPEIELEASGGVAFFQSDTPDSLAQAILSAWEKRAQAPQAHLSEYVESRYSAEAMANGLQDALQDGPTNNVKGSNGQRK
ncbi:glycosyltransferase [Pseudarthrobacter sp. AG30]|uniref:glycosyltransferase n=1 Tax=Pseudarthrobacter sp. AG30 TaxID=2249742 RepID=UPI000D641F12|nr:glycosyltransferase [Pseudarthrobacter sp. AG30]RAX17031.1 glycosyltransferase [Pseudarthrobacter sp. AG30]